MRDDLNEEENPVNPIVEPNNVVLSSSVPKAKVSKTETYTSLVNVTNEALKVK